ncbi:hypothetical protein NDU88_006631 [Pleurodeles waltl]|uniref:Uncharacterized protein n=1 Tax=Pleurodeles waltl TaxID=8319 RepID=A0AAV7SQ74_PLEWA|nr:hypothetical protein NDU88_006631 [Pleurodeles waltl]
MCLPAAESAGIQSALQRGEAPGERLRYWERAALELHQVHRGAARIPLQGNPSSASTSKVPGRNSQEPGSANTAFRFLRLGHVVEVTGNAGVILYIYM